MNILLVSQCHKKALQHTRRILDQFAERKGDRTWQTVITLEGLTTLRKMLKQHARRNTAVACHRIGGKHVNELLWVVGNAAKFNEEGVVPTNTTTRDIVKADDENAWHTAEDIAILASIAALFHDVGKANVLFQEKLKQQKNTPEPYRHEWVSLRLFQAFVEMGPHENDQGWLERLANVSEKDEAPLLAALKKRQDNPNPSHAYSKPFAHLPAAAKAVAWLILTHHKLPQQMPSQQDEAISIRHMSTYLDKHIHPEWNSPHIVHHKNNGSHKKTEQQLKHVWTFQHGTAIKSTTWCAKAQRAAQRALKRQRFLNHPWLSDLFTCHIARLALMLADHHYSSQAATSTCAYHDKHYPAYANTDRKTGHLKQKLDEHLIGVYRHAHRLVRILPGLKKTLPSISRVKRLKKRTAEARFRWQDKAFDLARSIQHQAEAHGFFGVNLASTGCGKTFANARIMYALANEKYGCRFNVALGLRTLTLQTGDALQERLRLDDDDMAVLIGSQAVRTLHQENPTAAPAFGSESSETLLDDSLYVRYEGALAMDSPLQHWLNQRPQFNQLVSAPIVVSTIDHLMPATEGVRGGQQIAPMLRLLTADIVLDEPDDFGLNDIYALTRLVHWAGLLGAKILLSSATLSPNLVAGLFHAYQQGRQHYRRACGTPEPPQGICCAWFDEKSATSSLIHGEEHFRNKHGQFIHQRVDFLTSLPALRKASLLPVNVSSNEKITVLEDVAKTIHTAIVKLHQQHAIPHPQNNWACSIGLVRMANINPLVTVAKYLLSQPEPENTRIYFCVYHSRHPLLVRSHIETQLDAVLNRKKKDTIWTQPCLQEKLQANAHIQHHIFVVLASPVAEIGRDHDYDWAIAEPSSLRAIIQLAGRIQRHRQQPCAHTNLLLLNQNVRAGQQQSPAFTQPGFEHKDRPLTSHALDDCLNETQYLEIRSSPCIQAQPEPEPQRNLSDLEHHEMGLTFNNPKRNGISANDWLTENATLTGEMQRRTRFRQSLPSEDYCLHVEEGDANYTVKKRHENGEWKRCDEINMEALPQEHTQRLWIVANYMTLLEKRIDADDNRTADEESRLFGVFDLRAADTWTYVPELGFYSV